MFIKKDLLILLLFYLAVALLPLLLHTRLYFMNLLIVCMIYAVIVASWDLIMGFAGIFTFGQVAFFVIGAYATGIITKHGVSPWLGMLGAAAIAAGIGLLIGLPCLHLKGAYVALVTFAVHMIIEPLFKSDFGRAIGTGGAQGLIRIPPLRLGSYVFTNLKLVPWYYTVFVISLLSLIVIHRILHSRWGLAFVAIRDSADFAGSLGVNEYRYKLLVFGLSAFFTGLIGGFYAHYVSVVSTRILGLDLFLLLMIMLVVGGMGYFPGAVFGAFGATILSDLLRVVGNYRFLIYGAAVMLLILFVPNGIMGVFLRHNRQGLSQAVAILRSKKP